MRPGRLYRLLRLLLRGAIGGDQLIVELDVFSGRPNPRWELDEASADALRRLVAGLAASGRPPAAPPGLGYRGFVFDGWRAWSGSVVRDGETLADPSLSVERFLADHLPAELQDLRLRIALD